MLIASCDCQAMAVDLSDDLVSMGIAAPVTKESAGKQYHIQLARQVHSFDRSCAEGVGAQIRSFQSLHMGSISARRFASILGAMNWCAVTNSNTGEAYKSCDLLC